MQRQISAQELYLVAQQVLQSCAGGGKVNHGRTAHPDNIWTHYQDGQIHGLFMGVYTTIIFNQDLGTVSFSLS